MIALTQAAKTIGPGLLIESPAPCTSQTYSLGRVHPKSEQEACVFTCVQVSLEGFD